MPIKFACPQCKTVITVDDKLAGKSGKCKCGATIRIPTPKPASAQVASTPAAPPPTSGLGAVFDDLTEADYNRQSPYQNVYAPPKAGPTRSAALDRFDKGPQKKKAQAGELNGTLIFIAILNFLWGLGAIGIAAILLLATAFIDQIADSMPMARAGLGLAIAFFLAFSLIFLSGGIGLLLKQKWGWFIVAATYAFAIVDRAVGLGLSFLDGFNGGEFAGSIIGLVAAASLGAFMYSSDTKKIYQIKSNTGPILAAVIGVVLALGTIGAMFALGAFADVQLDDVEQVE